MTRFRWPDLVWLVLVAAASSAWAVSAGQRLGPTFDEPFYLDAGLESWRTGSNQRLMTKGTMPLPVDVVTLPVYLWERWRGAEFHAYVDLATILPVARPAALPFWWLLLGYGMAWGRRLGGPWGGRIAVALLGSDPNLLGHAALATTDVALTATVLAAVYHFYANRDAGWPRRVLVPGVWYGIALTAKASAMAYVPLLAAVFGTHHLWETGCFTGWNAGDVRRRIGFLRTATRRLRWDLVYVMLVGLVWAFAYVGCDRETDKSFVKWANELPSGPLRNVMLPVSENLTIFSNAGEGLIQQVKHNIRGHVGAYLMGTFHKGAVWYYFPAALAIKLPDATLILAVLVLLLRPRELLANPAAWAAAVLLLFSLNTRVQIGVRIAFPFVAFLYIVLASVAANLVGSRRNRLLPLAFVAAVFNAAEAVLAWPDGVRFVNRLSGGPDAAPRLLADSNYDWGQGLPDLREWWRTHGEPPLAVWYYGGDPSILLPPFRLLHVHQLPDRSPAGVASAVGDGYLAVSVGLLTACPDRSPATLAAIEWLNSLEPAGRTPTFVMFRLR